MKIINELDQRAVEYQKIMEKHIIQKNGLVPMLVWPDTYKLPTEEDYAGAYTHRHLHGKTEKELGLPPMHVWRAWENTSSNTSFYLGALSYQYRCTRDKEVLQLCRRTLRALEYIYSLGVENGVPGFMCKPYGGVFTNQTSGDQVQCIVAGLEAYMDIAPKEDIDIIRKIVTSMADFYIDREFVAPKGSFFTVEFDEKKKNELHKKWNTALIYMPLLYLAWYSSGNERYIQGVKWWLKQLGEYIPDKTMGDVNDASRIVNLTSSKEVYLSGMAMKMNPLNQDIWRNIIVNYYRVYVASVRDNGMMYTAWRYDLETGKATPAGCFAENCITQTGRSAIFARGCADVQRWFKDDHMARTAYKIISKLGMDNFRFVLSVPGEKPLPEKWHIEEKLLDLDSLTAWLWTYWEGKWFGHW